VDAEQRLVKKAEATGSSATLDKTLSSEMVLRIIQLTIMGRENGPKGTVDI
jgi:hypothetical protein